MNGTIPVSVSIGAQILATAASGSSTSNAVVKPAVEPKRVQVLTDADRALLEKVAERLADQQRQFTGNVSFDVNDLLADIDKRIAAFKQDIHNEQSDARDRFMALLDSKGFQKILGKLAAVETPANYSKTITNDRKPLIPRAPAAATSLPASLPPSSRTPTEGLDGAQQKILDVVAMLGVRGIDVSRESVARWLDIHPNGGRYGSNLGSLRAQGYLDGFRLTEKGAAAADVMATGLDAAREPLDGAQRQILGVLENGPVGHLFTRETLAEALGIHPNGGRYGSNLGRLRTMGLIPDRGEIYLTEGALR